MVMLISIFLKAQTGIPIPEMTQCDGFAQDLLTDFGIPGMTLAITKDGKLIYMRAFGNANIGLTESVQPYHLMRIASISKPITSIAMMKLMENTAVSLSDKVFGTGGLLENHWYFSNATITDARINDITVQMLLEHSAGFNRGINCYPSPTAPYPYWFSGCDPIVAPLHVTQVLGESNPATEEMLITFLLERGLDFDPGTAYSYSNMGYLILGEIIEEVSGLSYEDYVKQNILHPLGIFDMHLGKNLLADKMERELEYIGEGYTNLSIYGDGNYVPWEYGGFNLEAFDAHGGWVATARDMVRLLVAIDGFATKPDILSSASITSMTTPSANASYYAKGWSVNASNNWWHTGAIDGTASEWVRTSGGYTWAIILNKRITTSQANNFWFAIDNLGWQCINNTTGTPTHDFLLAPTVNSYGLSASDVTENSMSLSWTSGNGSQSIVVAKELIGATGNTNFNTFPLDGSDYIVNNQFGNGDNLGDGVFVVYNGTGNSVSIENLNSDTEYAFRVYEFEKSSGTGNNALYMLGNAEELTMSTSALSAIDKELRNNIRVYPTISTDIINVDVNSLCCVEYDVFSLFGQKVDSGLINEGITEINILSLSSGMYIIRFDWENHYTTYKFIKN